MQIDIRNESSSKPSIKSKLTIQMNQKRSCILDGKKRALDHMMFTMKVVNLRHDPKDTLEDKLIDRLQRIMKTANTLASEMYVPG